MREETRLFTIFKEIFLAWRNYAEKKRGVAWGDVTNGPLLPRWQLGSKRQVEILLPSGILERLDGFAAMNDKPPILSKQFLSGFCLSHLE